MSNPAPTTFNKGYLFGLSAVLIWSGFIVVSRMGGLSALTPNDSIAIRYLTCSLILLPVWWFKYRFNLFQPRLIMCAAVGGLGYALCVYRGFELAPASHAAVLLPGLMPLIIIIFATVLGLEKPSPLKWIGVVVITLGVFTLMSKYQVGEDISEGHGWLILAAMCWGMYSVMLKRWSVTPWEGTISLALLSCMVYLPIYVFVLEKQIASASWETIALQALYQGFLATVVQMLLYVQAIRLIGASSMGSLMALVPFIAAIGSITFLDESWNLHLAIGLVLVSFGAWLSQTRLFQTKELVVCPTST